MMDGMRDVVIRIPPLFVMDFILHKINSSSPIEFTVETTSQIINFAFGTKFLYFGLGQIIILLSKPFGIAAALTVLLLPHMELISFYGVYFRKLTILLMCFYLSNWFLAVLGPPLTSFTYIAPFTNLLGTYGKVVISLCSVLLVLAASHSSPLSHEPLLCNRKLNALCITLLPCYLLLSTFKLLQQSTVSSSTVGYVACYLTLALMTPYLMVQARAYVARFRSSVMTGGILPCLQHEWGRLHLTPLLKIYWLLKVGGPVLIGCVAWTFNVKMSYSVGDIEGEGNQRHMCQGSPVSVATYFLRSLTLRSCDTTVTLLSTALTLSHVVDMVYRHLDVWLSIPTTLPQPPTAHHQQSSETSLSEEPSLGTASAILFLILAAQTGITASATTPVKLDRIGRNVVLMSVALLHLLHDAVIRPRLMTLAASGNTSGHSHARAHLLAWTLFGLAAWIGQHYYATHQLVSTRGGASTNSTQINLPSRLPCDDALNGGATIFGIAHFPSHSTLINSWLVSIAVLSAELCSKVAVSLLTYGLRLIDFHRNALLSHQTIPTLMWPEFLLKSFLGKNEDACKWDLRLDRALWYVGSIGGIMEFAFGLILFFNALWILTFESRNGGAIRAAMTLLHAYFNLWLRAQKGMGSFLRRLRVDRRLARLNNKITPTSSERLADDTCPICRVAIINHECGQKSDATYVITDCGHPFHSPCLRRWLYTREDCPMCRTPLSPTPTTSSRSYF